MEESQRGRAGLIGAWLLLTLVAAGCGGQAPGDAPAAAAPAGVATTAPAGPSGQTGRLRVTQRQAGCCADGDEVSQLVVRGQDGTAVFDREFQAITEAFPVMDERLPVGAYLVASAQSRCTADCLVMSRPTDRCSVALEVEPGEEQFLTVSLGPGRRCEFTSGGEPLASEVPDDLALVPTDRLCGTDASLATAADTEENVLPSQGRTCLLEAAEAETSAGLTAYEPGDGPGTSALVVYRLSRQGAVDVYQPVGATEGAVSWRRSTCGVVVPDPVRTFLLQGCRAAEVLAGG